MFSSFVFYFILFYFYFCSSKILFAAAITGSDDKQVKLWDVASRQALHTFHDHNEYVTQKCVF